MRNSISQSIILRFIIFFLLAMPFVARATDAKYPPYPEIWGYEVNKNYYGDNTYGNLTAYSPEQDNYWFSIVEWDASNVAIKRILVKFFEGITQDIIAEKDYETFYYPLFNKRVPYEKEKEAILSDGTKIILTDTHAARNKCRNEFIYKSFLEKRDSKGALLGRYAVIRVLPKPFELIEGDQRDECPTFSKGKIYIQAVSVDRGIVALADDTVLLYDWDGTILRLNKDIKTKYDSRVDYTTRDGTKIRTSIAIIPMEVIEKIRNELMQNEELPFQETLQQRLLDYISKNY